MDIQATLSIPTSQSPKRPRKTERIGTTERIGIGESSMTKTALAISLGMVMWAILVLLITYST